MQAIEPGPDRGGAPTLGRGAVVRHAPFLDPEALPVGAVLVDAERRARWWNDATARIWKTPVGAAPDLTPGRFVAIGDGAGGAAPDPIRAALEDGRTSVDVVVRIIRGDGSPATVSVSAAPSTGPDGSTGAVVTASDVTERHEHEEVRAAFIGLLAHELRTPITSLFGGVGLLRRDDLPEGIRRTVIEDLASEADRLHRLVEDLLVVARLEKGATRLERDPVLLQHVLGAAVEAERRHWPETRFELDVPADLPPVSGEDGPVEQVIRNLLSNAAKYGPRDGPVDVRVARAEDEVTVSVLDEGPGIPDWAVDEVFGLFYRLSTSADRAPGTGIGLFISRVIVESLGGRIWAAARPTGGAEVGFALPVYPTGDDGWHDPGDATTPQRAANTAASWTQSTGGDDGRPDRRFHVEAATSARSGAGGHRADREARR
jgi:signal transduction histidine kinase